jgi:plasmid stabilization system protein ParE
MVKKPYAVVWTKRSQLQLHAVFKYISEDSLVNAEKVIADILSAIEKASTNPEFYGPDKFKSANDDNSYRAFEKHRYRIAYRFSGGIIRVLRIRHTKMEPKTY